MEGENGSLLTRTCGAGLLLAFVIAACGNDESESKTGTGGSSGSGGSAGSSGSGGSSGSAGSDAAGGSGATDASSNPDSQSTTDGAGSDSAIFDARECSGDGGCGALECCYQGRCLMNGQACGPGNVCFALPVGAPSCQACGHGGQPCCTGNSCLDGSRCLLTPQGARCVN